MKKIKITYQNKLGQLFEKTTQTNDSILSKKSEGNLVSIQTLGYNKRKFFDFMGIDFNPKIDYSEPTIYIENVSENEQEQFWLLVATIGDYIGIIKDSGSDADFYKRLGRAISEHFNCLEILEINELNKSYYNCDFNVLIEDEDGERQKLELMLIKQPLYD
jgi:hypothetical protein